jgi:hypothetical protein
VIRAIEITPERGRTYGLTVVVVRAGGSGMRRERYSYSFSTDGARAASELVAALVEDLAEQERRVVEP